MKRSTKIRLLLILVIGFLLGFLSEIFLTFNGMLIAKNINSSLLTAFLSICGIALCGVVFLFTYLRIVKNDDKWPIHSYFTTFILYDVLIIFGGVFGKYILLLFIK